ncbi:MAG: rhodanese-like domain-containing protein [Candidatus Thorarchaeota archaeon]
MFNRKNVRALNQTRLTVVFTLAILIVATFTVVQVQAIDSAFESIDVDTAYDMTTNDNPNQVILDVRPLGDYTYGHLYNAISIPFSELTIRIGELQEYENHEIIVYCRTGLTSQMACELLAELGFTNLFNVLGGIAEWVKAGYPFDTTAHNVIVGPGSSLQIEPLLLELAGCSSCPEGETCGDTSEFIGVESTVLEEDVDHTIIVYTFEIDGDVHELTVSSSMLWSYEEKTSEANRTAGFFEVEVTGMGFSFIYYSLRYQVQHVAYYFVMETNLVPLDATTYNSSGTYAQLIPYDETEVKSVEFVEFESSISLSSLYKDLSHVAKKIGSIYDETGNEEYVKFAQNYFIMEDEIKTMSKLVKNHLEEYDHVILQSSAVLADDFWLCLACQGVWGLICLGGCSLIAAYFPPALPYLQLCYTLGCTYFSSIICDLGGWCPP